jgi:hypothetical protein
MNGGSRHIQATSDAVRKELRAENFDNGDRAIAQISSRPSLCSSVIQQCLSSGFYIDSDLELQRWLRGRAHRVRHDVECLRSRVATSHCYQLLARSHLY